MGSPEFTSTAGEVPFATRKPQGSIRRDSGFASRFQPKNPREARTTNSGDFGNYAQFWQSGKSQPIQSGAANGTAL
jgi:hypothetical protein